MSRNPNEDFDDILVEIAKKIYGKGVVDDLGKKLGFIDADTARYNEENAQQGVSHMGTLNMLRKWRQGQKKAKQREILKAALEKAGFVEMAEEYLSTDDVEQTQIHTPAAPTVQGASFQYHEREEGQDEVRPDKDGYYKQLMKRATPSPEQLNPEQNYKMDVLAKGHMFILNMTKDREGSDVDVKNIKHVFKEIGYETETHSDLTAKELKGNLRKFVDVPRRKDIPSAVFLFMAHGNQTGIRCKDEMVSTEFVRETVSGMKSMKGKPKMIFFQCCRGDAHPQKEETEETETVETDIQIPAKSDVFTVYPTTKGNVSYRNKVRGSWFIKMLCEVLLEKAHISDLSTMLEQVTGKVGKMGNKYGQCVVVDKQGVSKKLYFLPKYPPTKNE